MDPLYNRANENVTDVIACLCKYLLIKREYREDYLEYLLYVSEAFKNDPFSSVNNFDVNNVTDFIADFYMSYVDCTIQEHQDARKDWENIKRYLTEMDENTLLFYGYDMCSIRIIEQLSYSLVLIPRTYIAL